MKNNTSIGNICQLIKTDILSNAKKYLMWLGAAVGATAAVIFLITYNSYDGIPSFYAPDSYDLSHTGIMAIYSIFYFIICCISASTLFSCMSNKREAISWLTLPAGQGRKFISRLLITAIIIPILLAASFTLVDIVRYAWLKAVYGFSGISLVITAIDYPGVGTYYAFLIIAMSFFGLGSAVWPRWSALKTCIAAFIIAIIYTCIYIYAAKLIFNPGYHYTFMEFEGLRHLSDNATTTINLCVAVVVAIFNYTLAYFRYKEIEIIQRW